MMDHRLGAAIIEAQRIARPCAKSILRSCPEYVEDALQDAAVRAIATRSPFAGESAFSTWFTRIVIRSCLISLRKRKVRTEFTAVPIEEALGVRSSSATQDVDVELGERAEILRRAIARLPKKMRSAAHDMLCEKPSVNGTMKSNRFRARVRLRELLVGKIEFKRGRNAEETRAA